MDRRTADRRRALVDRLTREGFESPQLDRLRTRLDPAASHASLEREIAQEMAQALGRVASHVEFALLELEVIARDLDALDAGDPRRDALVAAFNAQRKVAEEKRHDLLIQREAVGLRHNEALDTMYPIPPKRT